jgi:hypothetical protein
MFDRIFKVIKVEHPDDPFYRKYVVDSDNIRKFSRNKSKTK